MAVGTGGPGGACPHFFHGLQQFFWNYFIRVVHYLCGLCVTKFGKIFSGEDPRTPRQSGGENPPGPPRNATWPPTSQHLPTALLHTPYNIEIASIITRMNVKDVPHFVKSYSRTSRYIEIRKECVYYCATEQIMILIIRNKYKQQVGEWRSSLLGLEVSRSLVWCRIVRLDQLLAMWLHVSIGIAKWRTGITLWTRPPGNYDSDVYCASPRCVFSGFTSAIVLGGNAAMVREIKRR